LAVLDQVTSELTSPRTKILLFVMGLRGVLPHAPCEVAAQSSLVTLKAMFVKMPPWRIRTSFLHEIWGIENVILAV
jgi:hypothetical protein